MSIVRMASSVPQQPLGGLYPDGVQRIEGGPVLGALALFHKRWPELAGRAPGALVWAAPEMAGSEP